MPRPYEKRVEPSTGYGDGKKEGVGNEYIAPLDISTLRMIKEFKDTELYKTINQVMNAIRIRQLENTFNIDSTDPNLVSKHAHLKGRVWGMNQLDDFIDMAKKEYERRISQQAAEPAAK